MRGDDLVGFEIWDPILGERELYPVLEACGLEPSADMCIIGGYLPSKFADGYILADTFLLPGMSGTPQESLGLGQISNAQELLGDEGWQDRMIALHAKSPIFRRFD